MCKVYPVDKGRFSACLWKIYAVNKVCTISVETLSFFPWFLVWCKLQEFLLFHLIAHHKSFGHANFTQHNIKHVLWHAIAVRVPFYPWPGLDFHLYSISCQKSSYVIL